MVESTSLGSRIVRLLAAPPWRGRRTVRVRFGVSFLLLGFAAAQTLFEHADLSFQGDDLLLENAFAFLRLLAEALPLDLGLFLEGALALPAALEGALPAAGLITQFKPFAPANRTRTRRCRCRVSPWGLSHGCRNRSADRLRFLRVHHRGQ